MTSADVDSYLAGLPEPKRTTLEELRRCIRQVVPEAEEGLSYGLPAFRVDGKVVAGFAAFKNHLSYLPHSGSVLPALAEKLDRYDGTKGSLHFPIGEPLPQEVVRLLVEAKLAQLATRIAGPTVAEHQAIAQTGVTRQLDRACRSRPRSRRLGRPARTAASPNTSSDRHARSSDHVQPVRDRIEHAVVAPGVEEQPRCRVTLGTADHRRHQLEPRTPGDGGPARRSDRPVREVSRRASAIAAPIWSSDGADAPRCPHGKPPPMFSQASSIPSAASSR